MAIVNGCVMYKDFVQILCVFVWERASILSINRVSCFNELSIAKKCSNEIYIYKYYNNSNTA